MPEFTGVTIDIRSLSKAFYAARKHIRLGVEKALKQSGPGVLKDVKKRAPKLRGNLKSSLGFSVKYKTGETSLSIMSTNSKVNDYFLVREAGPNNNTIEGDPYLAYVPRFSPFWSKTATVKSAKAAARRAGYNYHFMPEGSVVLLGVKRLAKVSRINVGAEYALIAIITPRVHQEGKPYIRPAFEDNIPKIHDRITTELARIFNGKV